MPTPKDAHSMALAAERKIMQMTGASRSQIRASALGTPLRDALIREQSNQTPNNSSVATPPAPRIESTEQEFRAKPFTLGDSGGGPAAAPVASGTPNLYVIFYNGALATANLMDDGAEPTPL